MTNANLKGSLKGIILNFMEKNCHGVDKAKVKSKILACLISDHNVDITERTLRKHLSILRKERQLSSHNSRGWHYIPLCTTDPKEIDAVIEDYKEKKSHALKMFEGIDRVLREYESKKLQWEMSL